MFLMHLLAPVQGKRRADAGHCSVVLMTLKGFNEACLLISSVS